MSSIPTRFNILINDKPQFSCGPIPDDQSDESLTSFALENASIAYILRNSTVTGVKIDRVDHQIERNGETLSYSEISANISTQDPVIYPTVDPPAETPIGPSQP